LNSIVGAINLGGSGFTIIVVLASKNTALGNEDGEMNRHPAFPLRWISLIDDEEEEYSSVEEMVYSLEEWDTDCPLDSREGLILDRYNRMVRVKISGMRLVLMELYDPIPIEEEQLSLLIEQSRRQWQERRERSVWARLCRWLPFLKRL